MWHELGKLLIGFGGVLGFSCLSFYMFRLESQGSTLYKNQASRLGKALLSSALISSIGYLVL
jgi:hypothetical protein